MVQEFADDTPMYLHCSRDDTTSEADHLERCIADIGQRMSANRLKLNTDKTELLWVRTRHSLSHHGRFPVLQLGPNSITTSDYVRLLGATDHNLERHVSVVSSSCFYWQQQLQRTQRLLDQESAATQGAVFRLLLLLVLLQKSTIKSIFGKPTTPSGSPYFLPGILRIAKNCTCNSFILSGSYVQVDLI